MIVLSQLIGAILVWIQLGLIWLYDLKKNEASQVCIDTQHKLMRTLEVLNILTCDEMIIHASYSRMARYYTLYAEMFMRKGDQSRAKENLAKAIEIYTECGADGWVKKYEQELATLT